jgi:hypothetical protein
MSSTAAFCVGSDGGNVIGAFVFGGKDGSRACVVIPDHFGWKAKKTRWLCNEIACSCRVMVVCPDIHRGNFIDDNVAGVVC